MRKEVSPGLAAAVIILVVVVALVALILFTNPGRGGGKVDPQPGTEEMESELRPVVP